MEPHINARQIKAARALLDWSQDELAQAAKLSIATIRKIESGSLSPRDKTMSAISDALKESGIEFTDSTGVRLRNDDLLVLEGDDCFLRLMDEVYYAMAKNSGELLFMNGDGSRMNEAEWASVQRVRETGVKVRILVEEGDTDLHLPLDYYRWVPKSYFRYNVVGIFLDKVAISVYTKDTSRDMCKLLILTSTPLAESMRGSFEFMWDNCRKPTKTTAKILYD